LDIDPAVSMLQVDRFRRQQRSPIREPAQGKNIRKWVCVGDTALLAGTDRSDDELSGLVARVPVIGQELPVRRPGYRRLIYPDKANLLKQCQDFNQELGWFQENIDVFSSDFNSFIFIFIQ
jgi:hypothetical protein